MGRGEILQRFRDRVGVGTGRQIKDHAHEKMAGFSIVELLRIDDIAPVIREYLGHAGHQSRMVRAG